MQLEADLGASDASNISCRPPSCGVKQDYRRREIGGGIFFALWLFLVWSGRLLHAHRQVGPLVHMKLAEDVVQVNLDGAV